MHVRVCVCALWGWGGGVESREMDNKELAAFQRGDGGLDRVGWGYSLRWDRGADRGQGELSLGANLWVSRAPL